MDKLWALIQDEAEAIKGYLDWLEGDFAQSNEAQPFVMLVRQIIADERDHMDALTFLYNSKCKEKPATESVETAKKALAEWKDAQRVVR